MHNKQRREFIKLGCQTLCGAGLALGAHPLATLAQAQTGGFQQHSDYRALVCIYLTGGSDGFNLLVPTGQAEYSEYRHSRQHLAPERNALLPLHSSNTNIPNCSLNQHASALLPLFEQGDLAFISNVGMLIEPTTKDLYEHQAVALPPQLFSHNDQEIQWQQLQGQLPSRDGWGALASQYLSPHQQRDYLTAVTLSGSNYWQSSEAQRPFSMESSGVMQYAGMSDLDARWQDRRREAFQAAMQLQHSHIMTQAYADLQYRASTISADLGAALSTLPEFATAKPAENSLAENLTMVAQMIKLHETLGMSRQIFYVSMDGWDTHDAQARELPMRFQELAEGMAYFHSCISEIGLSNSVSTFTASDFGRTLTGNGDGTDHGWGNHHMVMGGAVAGAQIYGQIPRLSVNGPDAIRNGRVVPSLSATQYAATLLQWLGLEDTLLDSVLPTLRNFQQRNIGFFT